MYLKGLLMILSIFYCILLIMLLCCKFDIAENYSLLGVKPVTLEFGWWKKIYILQVCTKSCPLNCPPLDIFFVCKMVELVSGGYVINKAYPIQFLTVHTELPPLYSKHTHNNCYTSMERTGGPNPPFTEL